ncbi:MAG TPA: nuclear transport factor 2 family protein [Pyrinomonadaceae bacterium]
MKKLNLTQMALVSALVAMGAVSCTPSGNTNTTTTTAVTATPAPTPDTNAIVAEITKLENDWPRIIRERDAAALRRFEADDIWLLYFNGTRGTKEIDVKDVEAGNLTFEAWEISEMQVKPLGNDAAVATLLITVKNGKYKVAENRSQDISGRYRAMDTFARRNGQWQIVASSLVKLTPDAERELAAAASASPKASPGATASPATKASPAPKASPTRRPPPPPAPASTP